MYHNFIHLVFTAFFRFRYRDRTTICRDILNTVIFSPKGKTKTNIMRGANLNYQQVNEYLDVLLKIGAIMKLDGPQCPAVLQRYRVTDKGLKFARELQILHDDLLRHMFH